LTAYKITKGYDLPLAGEADLVLHSKDDSKFVALNVDDIKDMKYKLLVREGDTVKVGTPICQSKTDDTLNFVSTVAGKVSQINRGERRRLLNVVVEVENTEDAEDYGQWSESKIQSASAADLSAHLKKTGMWYLLRQRPFGTLVNADDAPKAIFVNGMDSSPAAPSMEFIIGQAKENTLQAGLFALGSLTEGKVHLCYDGDVESSAFASAKGVELSTFTGLHPKGLVGTHINAIDPINKGDIVWTINAKDVALIGELLLSGKVPTHEVVAVTGANVDNKAYYNVLRGAKVADFVEGVADNSRIIEGSVLDGKHVTSEDFVSPNTTQITVIPEGDQQHYLFEDRHWAMAGKERFSVWNLFVSRFSKLKQWNLDTNEYGDHRGIVAMSTYDEYIAQDIHLNFLAKAILSEDIERMEKLGLYELAPEDVALPTFICPSKTDFSAIINDGLELLRKEG
jgi:Na+-transporting NADH:ubiquinone oxidoreductase subunit A